MDKTEYRFDSVVAETLLIPLYFRAKESRRGRHALLRDETAERLVAGIDYDYSKFDKAGMSAIGCVVRSNYFDEAVAGSTDETMTLMPIDDASRYFHTADNCINAAIGFTGQRPDGTRCTASLGIKLDLKPLITQAGIVSITPCGYDTTYYDVEVEVHYAGSRYVNVDVEQEHTPYVLTDFSDSPHYSMFKFTDIDSWGYARINISVKNDYGTDTAVIEIPRRNHPASVDEVLGDGNHTVEAYIASGQYLGRMHSIDELRATGERLLILRIYDSATDVVRTVKYICR